MTFWWTPDTTVLTGELVEKLKPNNNNDLSVIKLTIKTSADVKWRFLLPSHSNKHYSELRQTSKIQLFTKIEKKSA